MIARRKPAASAILLLCLAWLLCLAGPYATAQAPAGNQSTDNQHGHRIDFSAAYLAASDEPMVPGRGDARDLRIVITGAPGTQFPRVDSNAQLNSLSRLEAAVPKLISPVPAVAFEMWVEDTYASYVESMTSGSAGIDREDRKTTVYRTARDNLRKLIVVYAATIEALPEPGAYRVSFPEADAGDPLPAGFTRATPAFPAPQILREGDTLRLELYRNAQSDFRLVDYIHVAPLNTIKPRVEAPHDSYAADAEFNLTGARVQVNGAFLKSAVLPETLRAPIVWVYLPGYGRYDLSYKAEPNAERRGEVSASSLTFVDGHDIFRIQCTERIASGSGAYRVYAARDAAWIPADAAEREMVLIGTAPGR